MHGGFAIDMNMISIYLLIADFETYMQQFFKRYRMIDPAK